MEAFLIEKLGRPHLARLLDLDSTWRWNNDDSEAALRHQLEASLAPDLLETKAIDATELGAFLQKYRGPKCFRTQLLASQPSLPLLSAIKLFAKQVDGDPLNPLSGNAARVIYYAAIAAAQLRCGKLISQSSSQELNDAFLWAASQPGAEALRLLFLRAINQDATFRPDRAG